MSSLVPYSDARTLLNNASLVDIQHIHYANEPFAQPQDTPWLAIEAYSNVLDILDMGGNKWQERGTLLVYCCAPYGSGTDTLRALAKSVCNVFRNLGPRNPYYHDASIGNGGQSDDGGSYIMPVSIAFVYED